MNPPLVDLIRRPAAFFAAVGERPSLVGPALVAATLGATVVVRLLLLLELLRNVADGFRGAPLVYAVGEFAVEAPRTLVAASLLVSLIFFLGWIVAAGIIYVASRYFDSEGSFRRLLASVGWGQVPTLVPALCSTAYIASAVLTAPEISSEAAAESWLTATFEESLVYQGIEVLPFVAAVWTASLWLLASEQALDLTRRQALVCIAVPAAATILTAASGAFSVPGG